MSDKSETERKQELPYHVSPSNTAHLFSDSESPDCGQTIKGEWSSIYEPEMIDAVAFAENYAHLSFCSNCFANAVKMSRSAREARR